MRLTIFIMVVFVLIQITSFANKADSSYNFLLQKIKLADASVTAKDFAVWISEAAACEECTDELKNILTIKLHDYDALYKSRAFYEAMRLKGFIAYNLSLTGLTKESASLLTGEIATGHDAYLVAASLRALSTYIYKDSAILTYLLDYLTKNIIHDEYVDIEKYELEYPLTSQTSVKKEALTAIQVNGVETEEVKIVLEAIAYPQQGTYYANDNDLQQKAKEVLASFAEDKPSCCNKKQEQQPLLFSADEAYFATKWVDEKERKNTLPSNIHINDQFGRTISFKKLKGKPMLMAFFYTRCINPNKCSRTVTELGKLQQLLQQQNISDNVNISLISYDPEFDSPDRIKNYATSRGLTPGENMLAMNIPEAQLHQLMDDLKVEANYDGNIVNIHDVQLLLFDKNNKFVRMYGHIIWNNDEVVKDITKLVNE